jgi:hypothetical protein
VFHLRLKSSWISNIRSSITVENWTYVHITFLGMTSGIRAWGINIKTTDILYMALMSPHSHAY